jgi:hypothetical protein
MTLFADYTFTLEPTRVDVDGNEFNPNAFNITRAYLNVTGNVFRTIAFRITPDIVRETPSGSSVNEGLTFRLKYAYAQFTLDKWMRGGSFVRVGMQQTPWIDFIDSVYRYRFQGPTMEDRENLLSSADVGAAGNGRTSLGAAHVSQFLIRVGRLEGHHASTKTGLGF